MSEFDQDKDYQSLHNKYQANATELPPADLDSTILQAAHNAVKDPSKSQFVMGVDTQPVKRAWYVPVSYVAILVLSLSVVMKLAFEPSMVELERAELDSLIEQEEVLSSESVAEPFVSAPVFSEQPLPARKALKKIELVPQSAPVEISQQQDQVDAIGSRMKTLSERKQKARKMDSGRKEIVARQKSYDAEAPVAASYGQGLMPGASLSESAADVTEIEQSKTIKDQSVSQKSRIEKLLKLLENKQFVKLKAEFLKYRNDYPAKQKNEVLPKALLLWETENITKSMLK